MHLTVKYSKQFDASWKNWLQENMQRNCDPFELVSILQKNGFTLPVIKEQMGQSFPIVPLTGSSIDYRAIANTKLTRTESSGAKRLPTDKVQIYTLDDFLTIDECDRIIAISNQQLRPSTVTTGEKEYRTSSTSDLSLLHHPEVELIDEKISKTLGITRAYSEGIQAQRYDIGQEFKQHTDYFSPQTPEYTKYAGNRGQRTWTFMVYLNEGMVGGGTKFFALNTTFTPKKGMAVIWNNLTITGAPNPATMHSGLPIEDGHKIIITKWFRERGEGPMFC
ncbi:MAG: 2OG-Fe(II) oxygenase [Candidatus Obscuribacterales bacterium]|nr:2OG-Fe(II) oxygenase [Candidatus Obscuribacterales bacterium]